MRRSDYQVIFKDKYMDQIKTMTDDWWTQINDIEILNTKRPQWSAVRFYRHNGLLFRKSEGFLTDGRWAKRSELQFMKQLIFSSTRGRYYVLDKDKTKLLLEEQVKWFTDIITE